MYQRILVATDGSALSKKAVKHAISLAASTGASVIALKVVPRYPVSFFDGGATLSVETVSEAEKKWVTDAEGQLEGVVKEAQLAGVKAKTAVVKSDLVAESIISAARKHKADLVVMASHGRKGLKRILLGSEALAVLTHSTVPVLVLR
jgi:nucleotide-binding universal stress UspA family protein